MITDLYVDMDGTLAEFIPTTTLEELFEEGYFKNLKPHMTLVDAIKTIIAQTDINVYILSAYLTDSKYALKEKNEWLDKYLSEIPRSRRIFCPCGENKANYIPGGIKPTSMMLSDYSYELLLWRESGGFGAKFMNGINGNNGTWEGVRFDYRTAPLALFREIVLAAYKNEKETLKDKGDVER